MIVISDELVANEDTDPPLNHPVLGWHNVVTAAIISSDTEDPTYPATNLANPQTATKWVGVLDSPAVDEHIYVAVSGLGPIDYVGIAGHNFGTAQFTVSVEYQSDDSPEEWTELVEEMIPANDAPLIFRWTPQEGLTTIRIRLQPGTEAPEAAVVYVGKLLVFERGVQGSYTPLPYGRVANVITGRAESGDFMGRIITNSRTESDAVFIGLTPTWVREYLVPALDTIVAEPFFFAWNPEDFPLEAGFAWALNDPRPAFTIDGWCDFSLQMAGIVD